MKISIRIIYTIAILLSTYTWVSAAEQYKVLRVVDGHTIDIEYHGSRERIRLLCVNTPESVHPDKKQNIPMGRVASKYAKDRLSGTDPWNLSSRVASVGIMAGFWRMSLLVGIILIWNSFGKGYPYITQNMVSARNMTNSSGERKRLPGKRD